MYPCAKVSTICMHSENVTSENFEGLLYSNQNSTILTVEMCGASEHKCVIKLAVFFAIHNKSKIYI